ncbi:interleukin-22 receptor subunit alpha-1 isoform X1 [Oenanthe melanoleuca]|uniref:interleukin-22 receptor subunit alpha-1 isoform X1 n=1 Tax=Oenanthe melanoleuca TaxID=2939378 RepID=UPI0024C118F0|nr:interleukin-22 receptor subunit alpha-1 isoform X1 [Oenanthe melanoleuca]
MKRFLIVLAGVSVVGIVTAERPSCLKRAAFSSTNFENILTWETAAEIPPGTVFDVQYKQYGEKSWLSKRECQSITQLFCNLSRETENFREHFYGRVRARGCSSSWVRSERFEPRKETIIGPPQVESIPYVRSIKFLIRPPLTPLRGEDGQQLTVEDIYSKFGAVDYHLTIFNQRTQQQWTKNEHSKEFEVSNLDPDTEYNGTVYMCLLQRRSKPQVFWVRTLADKTWVLYCLVALAFCAGLVFAATAYVIYKYIKQRRAQPRALDFRGIPSFQPLTLTVEHIIKPLSLSKPSLSIPEVQLAQRSQHLDWALEPAVPSCPYQQQADVPALQGDIPAPSAYTPQGAGQRIPGTGSTLAMTYGLCVQGSEHDRSSQTEQGAPPDGSVDGKLQTQGLGKSCSRWDYKEQQPLWKSRDRLESVVIQGSPGQPQLLLQSEGLGNAECVSQLSLSLLEQGGCYRHQAELPLLLSAGKAAPDCAPEQELLPPLPAALLLSVRTGNDLPGETLGQWVLPEPFPHPADKVQLPETAAMGMFPAEELSQDTGTPLAMLFKDLDLKVQWDEEDSTEFY